MAMRLSGLMSGMDTESVIEQLVLARRTKVDDTKKAQTKLQWKTDAWKTLNSKILKLYNGILGSSMRFEGSYMKKVTKVSNSSVVSVITGDSAMNSVQSLKVTQMAKSAYLTGGQIGTGKLDLDSDSRMSKVGDWNFAQTGKINVTVGDKQTEINVTGATTMGELVQAFNDAGVNASFDEKNQRFYITSKGTGKDSDFTITAGNLNGLEMLKDLGLNYVDKGYYNNVVDTYYQSKVDAELKNLTNERAKLLETQKNLFAGLKANYKDDPRFAGVDMDAPDAVKERVSNLLNGSDDFGELSEEEMQDFTEWMTSLDNAEKRLGEIDEMLDKDENGKTILSETREQEVRDEAEALLNAAVGGDAESVKNVPQTIIDAKKIADKLAKDTENKYTVAHKDAGEDAVIELNGVEYTSSKNTFEINGLTLTVNSTTAKGETVTLTTQDDTDGIYDMIKSFIKEYNELINEMDKLYNAESAKGYEPLTSEEKEAMSESEIEEWETKIKDSLLRKDDTLGTLSNALKQLMLSGVTVNGKQMYLTNFGIETLSYFTAPENEKNAYHIDGDSDDPNTASNEDKLRAMIATDPQTVIDFFVGLSRNMYSELTSRMSRTEYSSAYTAYEDVRMKKEYDEYTSKIKELEKKLSDYEDKWYQKFAQMETALAKLQSSASAVTSLLGG